MKNDNKGFSLIELIVVIAIMAILVGVMAPNVMRYIEKAREGNDIQTLQTIYTAVYTSMLDPQLTKNKPGDGTYSLPSAKPATDESDFNYSVFDILGDVSGNIKFQSKAAQNGAAAMPTAAGVTVTIAGNDVTVTVGTLGVNKNGRFTPAAGG